MVRPKKAFHADARPDKHPSLLADDEKKKSLLCDFPKEMHNEIAAKLDELVAEALHKAHAPRAVDIAHTVDDILSTIKQLQGQLQAAHPDILGGVIGIGVQQGFRSFNKVREALDVQRRAFRGQVNPKGGRRRSPLMALTGALEDLYKLSMPPRNTLNKTTNARPFARAVIRYYKGEKKKD